MPIAPTRLRQAILARALLRVLLFGAIGVATTATSVRAGESSLDPASQGPAPPTTHQHAWVKQTRKDWVPPQTKRVQVGVDAKGNPVYETQIVKPGYWKTSTYFTCSCGAIKS